jgi:hypothetical protein
VGFRILPLVAQNERTGGCQTAGWPSIGWLALLAACAWSAACRPSISKYKISGQVRYGGTPIAVGSITFEPTEAVANRETVAVAEIRNGQYQTYVVGGPHRVSIRDLTAEVGSPSSRPLFWYEYHAQVDLPVQPKAPVQRDFDIPRTHR